MKSLFIYLVCLIFTSQVAIRAGDLHKACRDGDLEAAKRALAANPSELNQIDSALTPLMYAARTNAALVEFLLSKGADPKIKNKLGGNALHQAAAMQNPEAVALLIKSGLDVNEREGGGLTPAMLAANSFKPKCKETLKILIDNKADLTLKDPEGIYTIRQMAKVDRGLAKILKELSAKY